ncbi:MAG TPA: beta-N-acetylhexosaminidase, partial [Tepidisphaeraceae bacterium]|nr:beta-N-acetylhexosaminidase [Tepidisphaeraceae bacterium]
MASTLSTPKAKADNQIPGIIPEPQSIHPGAGHFQIKSNTQIISDSSSHATAEFLANLLAPALGQPLAIVDAPSKSSASQNAIQLSVEPTQNLGPEAYKLTITDSKIQIVGGGDAGVFYGIQTLRQLLPPQIESKKNLDHSQLVVPVVTIEDQPRYRWRGLMLDVSRHF